MSRIVYSGYLLLALCAVIMSVANPLTQVLISVLAAVSLIEDSEVSGCIIDLGTLLTCLLAAVAAHYLMPVLV